MPGKEGLRLTATRVCMGNNPSSTTHRRTSQKAWYSAGQQLGSHTRGEDPQKKGGQRSGLCCPGAKCRGLGCTQSCLEEGEA